VSAAVRRYPRPCIPPLWARSGHAQTLWGHLLPSRAAAISVRADATRREIALEDGDRLVVHTLPGTSGVRVHLFHGLSGDVDADYMRRTATVLAASGHQVWAVNHRGCGPGRGCAGGPYHSGSSADLAAVLAVSRSEAPELVHLAIGFSLSGNALLLMAAQERAPWLAGLIAVNPPVDIARASLDIRRGLCRLYERRFVWRLRRAIAERRRDGLLQRDYRIPLGASLCEFDDLYTAPAGGFASGADYYARCSAGPRLSAIRTPGVILTAADDPFVHPAVYRDIALPSNLILHVEACGGHVAYLERAGLLARPWLDGALAHYVAQLAAAAEPGPAHS
jgi:uncharacterized protein